MFLNAQEPIRTWTSSDGRTLEALFIEKAGSNVKIKTAQGREFTLPINRFSQLDQEYVSEAAARALFKTPEPFEDRGTGGVIIASKKGEVRVVLPNRFVSSYEVKFPPREVTIGESLPYGATIMTGTYSVADLLLTNGTLIKLTAESNLNLRTFWQKSFRATSQKVVNLKNESSPSRIAMDLVTGGMVVDIKKLNRQSSFMVKTMLGVAGIRGTQFGIFANSQTTELSVLSGQVDFINPKSKLKKLRISEKIQSSEFADVKVEKLPNDEKVMLAQDLSESLRKISDFDLSRLSKVVDAYSKPSELLVESALGMKLIWCPPNTFIMGAGDMESPNRSITLTEGFYLGKYEVTHEEYRKVTNKIHNHYSKGPKKPVNVTWHEAVSFCLKLNKKEKLPKDWKFSLPTEAEWEYACRAGTNTKYAFGDLLTNDQAGFRPGIRDVVDVGSYPPNYWGFFDMHGNVWEWCQNWRGPYPQNDEIDPTGPPQGTLKALRGGGFMDTAERLSSSHRGEKEPSYGSGTYGFRVALKKAFVKR